MTSRLALPFALLVAVQILDIAIHLVADQMEPIRIASNTVAVVGGMIALWLRSCAGLALAAAAAIYLALNLVFLANAGLINPVTGTPRILLFVLVLASLALVGWLRQRVVASSQSA
ncbi:MAG: hypothetical protein AAFY47_07650 [Pseudomonadota bacterium]